MTILTIDQLQQIEKDNPGKKIVYCSGSFDLTHVGHILFFEECKKYGDLLVVSVGKDSSLKKKGNNRPILNQAIRQKTIDSLKVVDYVYTNPDSEQNNPLSTIEHPLKTLKPKVFVINEDYPHPEQARQLSTTHNVELITLPRTCPEQFENISTSQIINKIKNANKAIFLDRDGVLNKEDGLLSKKEKIEILPGVVEGLKKLKQNGYTLIVITNQPVIARGMIDEAELEEIHNHLNKKLGNLIEAFYHCPHHPEMHPDVPPHARKYRIVCECRKPEPGMIHQAMKEHNISKEGNWMIGDKITDVIAGAKAGCKTIQLLTPTSHITHASATPIDGTIKADHTAKTFEEIPSYIITS